MPILDSGQGPRDLSGHEGLTSKRRFVVEKYAVAGKKPISLSVVHALPIRGDFADGVRTARMEGRLFALRRQGGPEHFRRTCLIEADILSGIRIIPEDLQ